MTLQGRLLLTLVPAAALAAQGMLLASQDAVHAALTSHVEQAGRVRAERAAAALAAGLASRSEAALLRELQDLQRMVGAAYAAVVDSQDRVLAHTNVLAVGGTFSPPAPEAHVLDVAVPVREPARERDAEAFLLGAGAEAAARPALGSLHVGLPLEEARRTEREITARLRRVLASCAVLTIALLLWLLRSLLAPIRLLVTATARIREGDYEARVPTGASTELDELARSFNAMSEKLSATTVSKDFLSDVLESIQEQLFVTDARGSIRLVNPATCALLGYTKEELLGKPAALLFDAGSAPFGPEGLTSLEEHRAPRSVEARMVTKAGETIPVLLSASVLRTANERTAGFVGAARDVREARRLEARVRQSEKLSAVGQLAAGIAHEINNPLGVILGFAQGVARRLEPGHALELPVRSIEREALRCKNLVSELLTFARTTSRELEPVDLDNAVGEALGMVEAQAKLTGARLTVSHAGGLPRVLANKMQLQQVVLNLAKNGLDAMDPGGELSIATGLSDGPQPCVWLSVADCGKGIPPELLGRIFEPFFTTKPVGKGTGLGLSLVSEILTKHSGSVEVDSRPGRTVFTVRLPTVPKAPRQRT